MTPRIKIERTQVALPYLMDVQGGLGKIFTEIFLEDVKSSLKSSKKILRPIKALF